MAAKVLNISGQAFFIAYSNLADAIKIAVAKELEHFVDLRKNYPDLKFQVVYLKEGKYYEDNFSHQPAKDLILSLKGYPGKDWTYQKLRNISIGVYNEMKKQVDALIIKLQQQPDIHGTQQSDIHGTQQSTTGTVQSGTQKTGLSQMLAKHGKVDLKTGLTVDQNEKPEDKKPGDKKEEGQKDVLTEEKKILGMKRSIAIPVIIISVIALAALTYIIVRRIRRKRINK